jgi:hypothetical protein
MAARQDDEHLIEHNYDGIQEYDNPLPRWWVYLFDATIVFSILYALNVPGIGIGKGRIADYEADVAAFAFPPAERKRSRPSSWRWPPSPRRSGERRVRATAPPAIVPTAGNDRTQHADDAWIRRALATSTPRCRGVLAKGCRLGRCSSPTR